MLGDGLETTAIILNLLVIAALGIVAYFIPAYLKKKGENLATKEDIGEITRKVESIKHEYSADLESLKAAIGSQLYIHQTRYQNEFNILKDLSEKIVELRDSALVLRPVADYADSNEPEEERKRKRLDRYHDAAIAFYTVCETRKPFYPDELYNGIKELDRVVWKEVVQYKNRTDREGRGFDPEYWEKAEANAENISKTADNVIELIRNRVKYWESFEF
jgi:hypothetical protein